MAEQLPLKPAEPPVAPRILMSDPYTSGSRQPVSALGESNISLPDLPAHQNQLHFDFVSPGSSAGGPLRYRYRLQGADAEWSPPTEQRTVTYANLAPGKYKFLVRAVTTDGVINLMPTSVTFTILPPIWLRWWFLSLAGTSIGLAIYAIYRYRLARLLELERVRMRIATDLHDDIGSSLSRMAILSEVVKQQAGSASQASLPMLNEIADSARGLVDAMRDIVWAIDPRQDELSNLVFRVRRFASDMLEARGVEWDFHAPSEPEKVKLDPDQRRHLILIYKEAINNAVRHARCRSVLLSLGVARHQLTGEIRDDGRGFDGGRTCGNGEGHGLENMRSRAAQLAGQLSIHSSPGRGTRVQLIIPLHRR